MDFFSKKLYLSLYQLAIAVLLTSCIKSLDKPSWEIENTIPLLKTEMTTKDFFAHENLQTGDGDSLFFIESLNLPGISLHNLIELDVSPFVRNMKLDNLTLADQDISQTTYLGDIIKEEGLEGFFPDGSTTFFAIPPITVEETTSIDATDLFESIHIKEGELMFYILNDLPVELSNIGFEIQNETSGEIIESDLIPLLPSGTSETRTYDLADKHIEGKLRVRYTFDVSIPAGTQINYSDSIHLSIQLNDLSIYSANAIFPEQVLLDHKEVVYLEDMGDVELTKATIQQGELQVQINSTLEQETYLRYTIPKATRNGLPFIREITIPAAPAGGVTTLNKTFPFDQYSFDFTGENNDTVNAFYNEVQAWIENTGEIVHLTLDDSIKLILEVKNLTPDYIEGYLGNELINIGADTVHFPDIQASIGQAVDIKGIRLRAGMLNETGIPGGMTIKQLRSVNTTNNQSVYLETTNLENLEIHPVSLSIFNITDQNANPSELLNIKPDMLIYALEMVLNPQGNDGMYQNFASSTHQLIPSLDVIIPLTVKTENLLMTDTIVFRDENDDPIDTKVREGKIHIHASNYFPFVADITIHFRDLHQTPMVYLVSKGNIKPGQVNTGSNRVEAPTNSTITMPVSRNDMWGIRHAHDAVVHITFNTIPKDEYLHIFSYYTMQINISADFIYEMDNRFNR